MALSQDPRYVSLARRAAGKLGTSATPIINAILAQWQCEIGANDTYPPRRNNPGNLAAGAAHDIGARYTVEPGSNPQPGNPIVTFASPEAGADAYGKLLATIARYAPVRSAVIARDGRAFLQAINASGYGGSLSCTLSVYGGSAVPAAGASFGGAGLPVTSGPAGMLVSAPGGQLCAWGSLVCFPVGHIITVDDTNTILAALDKAGMFGGALDVLGGTKAETYNVLQHQVGKPWSDAMFAAIQAELGQKATEANPAGQFGELFKWVPGTAANLAVITGIGILAYVGLRNLADGLGEG